MKWTRSSKAGATVDTTVDPTVGDGATATDTMDDSSGSGVSGLGAPVGDLVLGEPFATDAPADHAEEAHAEPAAKRAAMRRINLLPPEVVEERQAARVRKLVFVSIGGLVGLLAVVWLLTTFQGASVRSELAAQKSSNARLERQIEDDELQEPVRKQEELEDRVAALGTVLGQEVAFPRMLRELARVMPNSMYLDSVDLSVPVQQAPKKKSSSSTKTPKPPSAADFSQELKLDARASGGMDLTADWLDRTKAWPAVTRAWLNDQSKVKGADGGEEIDFSTSLQLNGSILSERAQRLARGELP